MKYESLGMLYLSNFVEFYVFVQNDETWLNVGFFCDHEIFYIKSHSA